MNRGTQPPLGDPMLSPTTGERVDGLYLFALGSLFFLLLGVALSLSLPAAIADFKEIYYGAKCVVQHHDPYNEHDVLAAYRAGRGEFPADPQAAAMLHRGLFPVTNLPATLLLVAPLTFLPFNSAAWIWGGLIAAAMLTASWLVWTTAAEYSPLIAGFLALLILANSEILLASENAAGLVVGLCVIGVWCLVSNRWVVVGILLIAVAMAIKPHDAGFLWLFFLLVGGNQRKRALWILCITLGFSVVAALWMAASVPQWAVELQRCLASSMAAGGRDNPGPASSGGHGLLAVISLQAVFSFLRDDPHFYNAAAYLSSALLLLPWLLRTVRGRMSKETVWLGLGAVAALSMLPVYHRTYDAKLLLLALPACAQLWIVGHKARWGIAGLLVSSILLTGDSFRAACFGVLAFLHLPPEGLGSVLGITIDVFAAPILLAALGTALTYLYFRSETRTVVF